MQHALAMIIVWITGLFQFCKINRFPNAFIYYKQHNNNNSDKKGKEKLYNNFENLHHQFQENYS